MKEYLETTVTVHLTCGECGKPLDSEKSEIKPGEFEITVEPCETCLRNAREAAKD